MPDRVVHDENVYYSSAARTATPASSPAIYANGHRGIRVFIDVTAVTATPSVVPTIEVYNRASNEWVALLTGAAITATTTAPTVYTIYPGVTAAANLAVSTAIGARTRIVMTHGDADSITYTVGYELIP